MAVFRQSFLEEISKNQCKPWKDENKLSRCRKAGNVGDKAGGKVHLWRKEPRPEPRDDKKPVVCLQN